ncbi:hypothetical protein IMSHALPRED_010586 [Imshaugia aleurites]|uniref:Cyanovirin-N domain-containing protein n=1 Tax=Imshaugia aleurites TaxID=172621 RepID=A0A8H3ESB6_9LECA|nr:hypothetical protein IMSHALPRED_010586 [Imshaugia aleurites]
MLPSTIFLSIAALLPLTLSAPAPKGAGLALASSAGAVVANDLDSEVPNGGYDPSSSCTYTGGNSTNAASNNPAWMTAMTACLNELNATNWDGTSCTPPTGGITFGFYKGENDYSDPVDCFGRCSSCLSSAINAGEAVTTKCQYEYRTHELLSYKTHTCTMGYDAGS